MKNCRDCCRTLPLGEFYAHAAMADGHLNKCKVCVRARIARHRAANLEDVRAYDRERGPLPHRMVARDVYRRTPQGLARLRIGQAAYIERNPLKRQVHTALRTAVRNGAVQIPEQCQNERCRRSGSLGAHHDDYAKPLEVRWLCALCHRAHHKAERQRKRLENRYLAEVA